MFTSLHNPASAYSTVALNTSVESADPHKLIILLYEGAEAACRQAVIFMNNGNTPEKAAAIKKALDIVALGLSASLDMERGGELAERLAALYDYMADRLVWANLKNEPSPVEEVLALLLELHEAWAAIDKNSLSGEAA